MKIASLIRLRAGTVVLPGAALVRFVSPWWHGAPHGGFLGLLVAFNGRSA